MTKTKKKLLITTIIILLVIGVGLLLTYILGWFNQPSGQQVRYMKEINEANSVVWYYGELDPGDEITINYEKVTEFTDEAIGDKDNKYKYHVIVIYDFDGKMDISNEELLRIKDYCENEYYDLLYYGTEHLEQFRECGFFAELDSSEYGFTYNGSYWEERSGQEEYLNPYLLTGNWSDDDNERYDTEDEQKMWKFAIQSIAELLEYLEKGAVRK